MTQLIEVSMVVNGERRSALAEPRHSLAHFLRDKLRLTGTHLGCEHGSCGACTVLVEGRSVRACLMFAVQAQDANITTIEGIAQGDELSDLQRAFQRNHALQCGFCTPGQIMAATELLADNPDPSPDQVRHAMSGNICRCTGYVPIIDAILEVAAGRRESAAQQVAE
ncbi:MAG: (2Fe-2S)-binding protein [Microbacterium sp.]